MHIDRYVKFILTIIAVELLWIGLKDGATPVGAQAQRAATPVVITGIELSGPEAGMLPVAIVGSYRRIPAASRDAVGPMSTEVTTERPVRVETDRPLDVTVQGTVRVTADRPLRVENVGYTPGRGPGE